MAAAAAGAVLTGLVLQAVAAAVAVQRERALVARALSGRAATVAITTTPAEMWVPAVVAPLRSGYQAAAPMSPV